MNTTKALVLVDPVTDWKPVVDAAHDQNYTVIALQLPPVSPKFSKFVPSSNTLIDAGVSQTLLMEQRDIFSSLQNLQILSLERDLVIVGVIPLSEVAVEVSDILSAGLGLPHNPLDLMTARRDKGLMKGAVLSAGLRVAKHARVDTIEHLCMAVRQMSLSYPVVVKTPSGMSTSDVYICADENESSSALDCIIGNIGPDGRSVSHVLLEEFIAGTEFALNLMAFQSNSEEVDIHDSTSNHTRFLLTDMWKYNKNERARYESAEICNPGDYPELVAYAIDVARAVGIRYGAAHVELKSIFGEDGLYKNPTMIEVGARLSGGRKSILAKEAIPNWNPFIALIQSHCGGPCPVSFVRHLTPKKFVRHIFLPVEKPGRITKFEFSDSCLGTYHSSARILQVGDIVRETTDILSHAGFVWLVGAKDEVDRDTKKLLSSYILTTE
ncbi:hypothetical protein HJC23_003786 [Cyclotella cryptica]|uniref:ATP-grasp domain-containing protein n=1 Tax=Cyclotella cryptica TaxID=29204 RepID=A0ABD3QTX9_9STRA|eukprot:CCRYP_002222-RA/>CCRYP_002222-RA protein AED:0.18 eAED:0.18 QI:0/-1/0/1/-1/1/1/0/438